MDEKAPPAGAGPPPPPEPAASPPPSSRLFLDYAPAAAAPPAPPGPAASPPPIESFVEAVREIWDHHLAELEQWAQGNLRDARHDAVAFWALKVPAILASASAGIWAHFNLPTVSVIAGAIASVCVIVDGIHPRGMLRNTHLRAVHDLRILTSRMTSQFRSSVGPTSSLGHLDNTVRKIIRESEPERERIAAYIRDAETSLKPTDQN
jgi:hypothetical protein